MGDLRITTLAIPILCLHNMKYRDEKVWNTGFMVTDIKAAEHI